MPRVRWNDFSRGWYAAPGDDVPANALREATGIRPFYGRKSIKSRYGNEAIVTVGSGVQSLTVWRGNILYSKANQGGTLYRLIINNTFASPLYTNLGGHPLRFASGIPNPDIDATKFSGRDVTHLFVVGLGLTPAGLGWVASVFPCRKYNNQFLDSPMGLDPPTDDFVVGLQAPQVVVYDLFELSVLQNFWVPTNATTSRSSAGAFGVASLKVSVTANETGWVEFVKSVNLGTYTTNFNNTPGVANSSKQDWIRFWVNIDEPANVDHIELIFDAGGPASVPADRTLGWERSFSFSIFVADSVTDDNAKVLGVTDTAAGSDKRDKKPFFAGGSPRPTTQFGSPTEDDPSVAALEVPDVESARVVEDLATTKASPQSNVWTHLRIPKMLFEASQEDMVGKDHPIHWSHVRRCRIVVVTNDKGNANVLFDDLDLHLGVGMQGDYKVAITHRNANTGTRSMPSAVKEVKSNLRQAIVISQLRFTGENGVYATQVEEWRTLGNGNVLFLAKQVDIPKLTNGNQIFDIVGDYEGLQEKITIPGLGEQQYLKQVILPEDNVRLSRFTFDIAGPYLGRMWSLVKDQHGRIYYSPPGRLEVAAGFVDATEYQLIALCYWNTMYGFADKGIVRLITQQEPFIFEEVFGAPGTIYPDSIKASKFGIVYYNHDGVQLFNGSSSTLVGVEAIEAYFQSEATPNTPIINSTGAAVTHGRPAMWGNVHEDEYFLSDGSKTLAVSLRTGVWRTIGVGMGPMIEEDTIGHMLAITNPFLSTGKLNYIEISSSVTDDGTPIPFYVQTGIAKLEDQSGATKILQRFYLDMDCGGNTITPVLIYRADGSLYVLPSISTSGRQLTEYALCLPCDVVSVRLTGALVQPVELYEIGLDVHLPEEGGKTT